MCNLIDFVEIVTEDLLAGEAAIINHARKIVLPLTNLKPISIKRIPKTKISQEAGQQNKSSYKQPTM